MAILGFYWGGHYTWIAIGAFPAIAILDALLPLDQAERKMKSHFWAYLPVWMATLLLPVMYFVFAWSVGNNDLTGLQMAAGVMGLAWLSVVPGVPATHELYHSRGRLARFVGRYGQVAFLDCMRMEVHVVGHHRDVGTAEDIDTAARGVNLYRFVARSVAESVRWELRLTPITSRSAVTVATRFATRSGVHCWPSRYSRLCDLCAGWLDSRGVVLDLDGDCSLLGRGFQLLPAFRPGARGRRADREATRLEPLRTLSRLYAFEITNHADHHLNSYIPYYKLVPDREAIIMPSIIVCFLSGFVPSLWYNAIIKPALKRWDNEYASPAERRLAREQNREAGWKDWFDDEDGRAKQPDAPSFAHG
ncbi:alkane 1-monooxygenase [Thauera humireducens]|uniref:alkane 1-monooxygenase n=1 Tax=Thauera humireducens TaxID=1134435 RepID=UPI00311FC349